MPNPLCLDQLCLRSVRVVRPVEILGVNDSDSDSTTSAAVGAAAGGRISTRGAGSMSSPAGARKKTSFNEAHKCSASSSKIATAVLQKLTATKRGRPALSSAKNNAAARRSRDLPLGTRPAPIGDLPFVISTRVQREHRQIKILGVDDSDEEDENAALQYTPAKIHSLKAKSKNVLAISKKAHRKSLKILKRDSHVTKSVTKAARQLMASQVPNSKKRMCQREEFPRSIAKVQQDSHMSHHSPAKVSHKKKPEIVKELQDSHKSHHSPAKVSHKKKPEIVKEKQDSHNSHHSPAKVSHKKIIAEVQLRSSDCSAAKNSHEKKILECDSPPAKSHSAPMRRDPFFPLLSKEEVSRRRIMEGEVAYRLKLESASRNEIDQLLSKLNSRPVQRIAQFTAKYAHTVGVVFRLSEDGGYGVAFRDGSTISVADNTITYVNRHHHAMQMKMLRSTMLVPARLERKVYALMWARDVLLSEERSTAEGVVVAADNVTVIEGSFAKPWAPRWVVYKDEKFIISNESSPYPNHVYYDSE